MEGVAPRIAAVLVVLCVVGIEGAPRNAVQQRAAFGDSYELEILRIRPNFSIERLSSVTDQTHANRSTLYRRVRGNHRTGRGSSLPLGKEA